MNVIAHVTIGNVIWFFIFRSWVELGAPFSQLARPIMGRYTTPEAVDT